MLSLIFHWLDKLPPALRRPLVHGVVDVLLAGFARISVAGAEHIPAGPVLYVCNHLSNVDGLILNKVLHRNRPVFVAGVKLQGTPMTRVTADLLDTITVTPNSPDIDAIKRAIEQLKNGRSVLIFPEGGRSRPGTLLRGKAGAVVVARRAGLPIVPVALMGTEKLLPIQDRDMGSERPRHARVTVRIGRPFTLADLTVPRDAADERQALTDALMMRIAELLEPQYQGEYPLPAPGQQVS